MEAKLVASALATTTTLDIEATAHKLSNISLHNDADDEENFGAIGGARDDDDDNVEYGELILLGYNGTLESSRPSSHGRKHRSKMTFKRRAVSNGVKKGEAVEICANPKQAAAVQDNKRHVVTYAYNKSHTVLVEYIDDTCKDMFQIGRSSEEQVDFTIVDTWLLTGPNCLSPAGNNPRLIRSPHRSSNDANVTQKPISSTISRFACRILADRVESSKAYIFAAGFDNSRNIFLGEKATKWQRKNGECDGLTTNGVLILHPNHGINSDGDGGGGGGGVEDDEIQPMYTWREVSVDGDVYTLRETRSSTKRGSLVYEETNQLQDGTLIDLCGATLLWRSADGLQQSPSRETLEQRLDELNAGKPQCPVNLNTLVIPRKKCFKTNSTRQPYAYIHCGHVQGKHSWGVTPPVDATSRIQLYKCPICLVESERIIQLTMGMEPAFHLDSGTLEYAFNPCGHVASLATVRKWTSTPMPQGTNSFHPVCPFCTALLDMSKPYVRLIFQDHCYDSP